MKLGYPLTTEQTDLRPTPRRSVGHPLTLTEKKISALADIVSQGNYMTVACRALSIPYSTYQTWRARGEKDRADGTDSIYVTLLQEIEQANAVGEANLVHQWYQYAKTDWRAAKDFLSRRFPDRWNNPSRGGSGDPTGGGTTGEIVKVHVTMGGKPESPMPPDPDAGLSEATSKEKRVKKDS